MRTLVLGLGESGLAMVRWLAHQGVALRVADSRHVPPGLEHVRAAAPEAQIVCGEFTDNLLYGIDRLALSPGLAMQLPIVQQAQARGIAVVGEIELFAQALESLAWREHCKILAITGTNGKTTTTALVGALCRAAGQDVEVAGNISPAALDALLRRVQAGSPPDVWVLELSSFQLESTLSLRVEAGAILNLSDDHLDRHGSMIAYAAAKARLFELSRCQVFNRDDVLVRELLNADKPSRSFGLDAANSADDFGLDAQGKLCAGSTALMAGLDLQLAGSHNLANAMAALALCESIALPRVALLDALRQFRSLPHRVELVAQRDDGVRFYDDSKGTNVGATVAALNGLAQRVVLIAGGDGKGQDFSPLVEPLRQHVRAVVLIGKDAARFQTETAASDVPMQQAWDMPAAVRAANTLAQPGDVVLLSPACASMDMFRNYAHRAEVFVTAVLALPGVSAA